MNNQSNDGYSKGFLFGALIGGAVGAITALLFAPKSGRELRADIAEKSGEICEKSKDYIQTVGATVGEKATEYYGDGKEKAAQIIDAAKRQAEGIIAGAEKVFSDAKNKTMDAKDVITDKVGTIRDAAKAGAETFRTELKKSSEI